MKPPISIITLVICCISFSIQSQKLSRIYKKDCGTSRIPLEEADQYVKIDFVVNDDVKPYKKEVIQTKVSVKELSDRGQQALIEKYSDKTTNVADLYKYLSKPLLEPVESGPDNKLFNNYIVHMEFDVTNVSGSSVNNKGRITELFLKVEHLNSDEIEFVSFKELNTAYEYINFGDVEETRTQNFSLNVGAEIAGTGSRSETTVKGDATNVIGTTGGNKSNVGANYGASKSTTEKISQLYRVISQMGTMSNAHFSILQQGTPKNDLNGKIALDLVVEIKRNFLIDAFKFSELFPEGKPQQDSSKVKVAKYLISYPNLSNDIKLDISYQFQYREIVKKRGRRTRSEHDDIIETKYVGNPDFVKISKTDSIKTTAFNDYKKYWVVGSGNNLLNITYAGKDMEIKFETLEQAQQMEAFLKTSKFCEIGGYKLRYGYKGSMNDLTKADINGMGIISR